MGIFEDKPPNTKKKRVNLAEAIRLGRALEYKYRNYPPSTIERNVGGTIDELAKEIRALRRSNSRLKSRVKKTEKCK